MKFLRFLLVLAVLAGMAFVGALFAAQNDTPVPLDLLFYTAKPQTLALWVLLALAIGGVLGMLFSSALMLRTRASSASAKRQLDKAQSEVKRLREALALSEAA